MSNQKKLIQIYPQSNPGSDVIIIGNAESLKDLRTAIDNALSNGQSGLSLECSLGHDYRAIIIARNSESVPWASLPNHYQCPIPQNKENDGSQVTTLHPMDLLNDEQYLEVMVEEDD